MPKIIEWLHQQKIKNLAIESDGLSIKEYSCLSETFNVTIWSSQIQQLRAIKSAEEIQLIKNACTMTDEILRNYFQVLGLV